MLFVVISNVLVLTWIPGNKSVLVWILLVVTSSVLVDANIVFVLAWILLVVSKIVLVLAWILLVVTSSVLVLA
jgi:hypothetical protein